MDRRGGTVTVGTYTDVRLIVVPETSEGLEGAEHIVTLRNAGNTPAEVSLSVAHPEEALAFSIQPAKHVLEPGGSAESRMRVWLRQGVSRPGQRFAFKVVAEPVQLAAVVVDASFKQIARPEPIQAKPTKGPWLWPAGLVAGLALAVVGVMVASSAGILPWSPQSAHAPSATMTPTSTATASQTETSSPPRMQRFEAEALAHMSNTPDLVISQPDCCGNHWSGNNQLWFKATAAGQYVTLSFGVDLAARYRVEVRMTKAPDYGVYSLELDGQTLVPRYDGYFAGTVGLTVSTEVVPLSAGMDLSAGTHSFTIRVVGTSGAGYFAGVDYIDIVPV